MNNKIVLGIYDDDEVLLEGLKKFRDKGIKIKNVFSPFPIHGIDGIIGIRRTRLAICSFLYGATGTTLALLMMWYMMIHDWPMDIGGKPSFALYTNLPAFIPVTFEITVLCAAHGMALTFLLRSKILPGVTAYVPDIRSTDDKFVVEIHSSDQTQINNAISLLRETGAIEVKEK